MNWLAVGSKRHETVARTHVNVPSKGAKMDEELRKDDEECLKRKGNP